MIVVLGSCTLPDYRDVNPKQLLDAPAYNITPSGSAQATANGKTGFDGRTIGITYVQYGGSVDFAIDVVDCPGKVADVSCAISVPSYATTTVDATTLTALKGQPTGSTKVTVVAEAAPDANDRAANLVFNVADGQVDGSGNPLTTTVTWPVVLVSCVSTGITPGVYQVTDASGNLDGGATYDLATLEADHGGSVFVTVSMPRPGLYTFNEVTGGIWSTYYTGRASPVLSTDLCNTTVSGHPGLVTTGAGTSATRTFTIDGTLNNDNTITITWSYTRLQGTPASPAQGTYTLTKL